MLKIGTLWVRVKGIFFTRQPESGHAARWRAHKLAIQKEPENLMEGLVRLNTTKKPHREMRVLMAPRMVKAKDLLKEKEI